MNATRTLTYLACIACGLRVGVESAAARLGLGLSHDSINTSEQPQPEQGSWFMRPESIDNSYKRSVSRSIQGARPQVVGAT